MIDLLVWLGIVLFCQAAILRIWLEGELFSEVQEFIGKFQNSRFFIIRKVAYLLSCWQCLGVWVAWGVLVIFSLIPGSPVTLRQWPVIILLGFMVSLLSELLHHYILIHLDVIPVTIDDNTFSYKDREDCLNEARRDISDGCGFIGTDSITNELSEDTAKEE